MDKANSICPLCGDKASSDFFGLPAYWYCKSCELAWKKSSKKAVYDETYYKGKSSMAQKLFYPIALFFYGVREAYAGIKKINIWIDVGAGEGGFVKTVHSKRKIGVEISKSGRKMMEEIGLEALTDQQFLKAKDMNADVISFWQVLEHVENPWDYLKAAKRNLKKEGKIVIGVPNFQSLEFHFAKEYWFHLQPEFHLWHFSPKSLKMLLQKAGFSIENSDYWAIEHHLTGILQSFINKTSGSKENFLHRLLKRSASGSSMPIGDVFWSLFWLTIGLPVVIIFWIIGSLTQRSGTMVVVAKAY